MSDGSYSLTFWCVSKKTLKIARKIATRSKKHMEIRVFLDRLGSLRYRYEIERISRRAKAGRTMAGSRNGKHRGQLLPTGV